MKIQIIYKNNKKMNLEIYITLIFCIILIYYYMYEFKYLDPMNVEWTSSSYDLAQHYIGWEAFRRENLTFPFGMFTSITYPFKTSLIFTDSIPILAFIFKPLNFILPDTFQYIGLWGFLCYIFQGIFSAKIMFLFFKENFKILYSSLFFVISPILVHRMYIHTALSSHWIILFSFYIYLNDNFSYKKYFILWIIISFLSSFIHIHLFAINGIILFAFCLKKFLNGINIIKLISIVISYISISIFNIGFILGGFSTKTVQMGYEGLDKYSMNLNGFFNSYGNSLLSKKFEIFDGQKFEGFCYLGLGCNILLLFIAYKIRHNMIKLNDLKKDIKNWSPLLIIFILSYILALSPKITLNQMELFSYKIPSFIENLWSIFRATGRFSWICVYLIYIFAFYMINKYMKQEYVSYLFIFAFFIQFIELQSFFKEKNSLLNISYSVHDENWEIIFHNEKIKHLFFGSNIYYFKNYMALNSLNNNKTINRYYLAHQNDLLIDNYFDKIIKEENDENIYILNDVDKNKILKFPNKYYFYKINEWNIIYRNKLDFNEEFYPNEYNYNISSEKQMLNSNQNFSSPKMLIDKNNYAIYIKGSNLNNTQVKLLYSKGKKNYIHYSEFSYDRIKIYVNFDEKIRDFEIFINNYSNFVSFVNSINIFTKMPCVGKCVCKNFKNAEFYYKNSSILKFSI